MYALIAIYLLSVIFLQQYIYIYYNIIYLSSSKFVRHCAPNDC